MCALPMLLLLLLAPDASATVAQPDRDAFLAAVREVENPRGSILPGRAGELGAYQFTSATWHMHTSLPFSAALDRPSADGVARKHFDWLRRGLIAAGLAPSVRNLAAAWNAGLAATIRGSAPTRARDYAQRVENLMNDTTPNIEQASPRRTEHLAKLAVWLSDLQADRQMVAPILAALKDYTGRDEDTARGFAQALAYHEKARDGAFDVMLDLTNRGRSPATTDAEYFAAVPAVETILRSLYGVGSTQTVDHARRFLRDHGRAL